MYQLSPCILAHIKWGQIRNRPKFWGHGPFTPVQTSPALFGILYYPGSCSNIPQQKFLLLKLAEAVGERSVRQLCTFIRNNSCQDIS